MWTNEHIPVNEMLHDPVLNQVFILANLQVYSELMKIWLHDQT